MWVNLLVCRKILLPAFLKKIQKQTLISAIKMIKDTYLAKRSRAILGRNSTRDNQMQIALNNAPGGIGFDVVSPLILLSSVAVLLFKLFGHALKNTLVPVITITGLQLGSLIAFAIITETVFQWPGMGLLFLQSIQFADIPVMSTYLILIAFFFVIINLVVDILYHVVDPRLRFDKSAVSGH